MLVCSVELMSPGINIKIVTDWGQQQPSHLAHIEPTVVLFRELPDGKKSKQILALANWFMLGRFFRSRERDPLCHGEFNLLPHYSVKFGIIGIVIWVV